MRRAPLTRRYLLRTLAAGAAAAGVQTWGAASVTPEQIEGPFYPDIEPVDTDHDLTRIAGHDERAHGEVIVVHGRVLDARGQPLDGARVDVWQANHHGRYAHTLDRSAAPLDENFQGWGIVATNASGVYRFTTVKPGPYEMRFATGRSWRCRHIHFKVSHARAAPLTTQMYFRGDPLLARDMLYTQTPVATRELLVADLDTESGADEPRYRFDIVLADA